MRMPAAVRARGAAILAVLAFTAGLLVDSPAAAGPLAVAPGSATARPSSLSFGLPLGPAGLPETRTVERLAPGVTLTTIQRGQASPADVWTVTAGFFPDRAEADDLAGRLVAAGFSPRVEQVDGRAADDPERGPVGFQVRVGASQEQAAMNALAGQLAAAGFAGVSVTNTALDGTPTTGPWVVRVLRVQRGEFRGRVRAHLTTDVIPDRETVSSLTGRVGALAGVNAGYFVINSVDGTPGDLAGISVLDGRLVSEAVNGRAALTIDPGSHASVTRLASHVRVRSSDGASRPLNGLNRAPGLIRSCGEPGDLPTELPKHDFTCTNPDELVAFDADFGTTADAGAGVQAVLDRHGRVLLLEETRGAAIPAGGTVLEGIGAGAAWLRAHAQPGRTLRLDEQVSDASGRTLRLRPGVDVVNGGPLLVRAGRPFVDAFTEGFVQPDIPSFYLGFGVHRNPRTMAGVTAGGDVLLVTVDGRQPGYSVGLSFAEEAAVMGALGAEDALNLDGGGSTTMVAGGQLLGRPSDTTGERPVGDALLVQARG
jgi:hypothetical protein